MKILALDVSTNTGVCVGTTDANRPKAWTVSLGKLPTERKLSNALVMTQGLILSHSPDLIVIEAPIGGKKVNPPLIKMVGCIEACAYNRGVKTECTHLGTVRKHFLGRAYTKQDFPHLSEKSARAEIKRMVMHRCTTLGWAPENDDESDAMALWDYACAHFGRGYQAAPTGELFAKTRGTR